MKPAPPPKAPAPPADIPMADRMDDEDTEKQKLSTRKKKALEIKKVKEGVKTLGAIDPSQETIADVGIAPTSGINTPM
tara:strand:+ start:92 stop:325 length:234 start_codon:yes stop_codon:yes gene_type:complete